MFPHTYYTLIKFHYVNGNIIGYTKIISIIMMNTIITIIIIIIFLFFLIFLKD